MQFSLPVVKEHKRGAQMRPVLINTQCPEQYQLFWAPTDPALLILMGLQGWRAKPQLNVSSFHRSPPQQSSVPRDTGWSSLPPAALFPVLAPLTPHHVRSWSHSAVSRKLIQLKNWRAFCHVPRMGERDKEEWVW